MSPRQSTSVDVAIGVDWGTTNMRAFLFDAGGEAIAVRASVAGARNLAPEAFEPALLAVIEDWLDMGAARIVVCGMAGARGAWVEAGYVDAPCLQDAITEGLALAPGRLGARVVPGLILRDAPLPDVMRGEETQVLGAVAANEDVIAIAPGTHSKWIAAAGGRIDRFRTWMTGEMFGVLRQHSILGALMTESGDNPEAFARGVEVALSSSARLAALFSARTQVLAARLGADAAGEYLSGLLIGAEIAEGLAAFPEARSQPVRLLAAPALAARYRTALSLAGVPDVAVCDGGDAAARGLWRIHQTLATGHPA